MLLHTLIDNIFKKNLQSELYSKVIIESQQVVD